MCDGLESGLDRMDSTLFVLAILSRIEDRRRRRRHSASKTRVTALMAPSLTGSPTRTTGSHAIKAATRSVSDWLNPDTRLPITSPDAYNDYTMTLPRERLSYSSPFTRPPLKLPGKARMIVWSVVNIEEWEITRPMARQLSQPPMGQTPIPDMPNWTWYEYGMRVGFWRLKRALQNAGVTPTMSINAKVCETYPEVAAAARDANWEFMAHAFVQMPIQQIEDQRAVIKQSCDLIEKFTGKRPTGWLGPGRGQTFDTLDYVSECGLTWFGDWILDDQPLWVKTKHGPILAVPYSAEINDITLMVSHHHESDVLLKRTIDAFDRLYAESADSARVMAIGVHPYVTGAAHRIKYFEQLYDYINRHDVVHWTGQQIYDWYAERVPR
jgi:allantoinase